MKQSANHEMLEKLARKLVKMPLPLLRTTRRAIGSQLQSGGFNPKALGQVVARDPLCVAGLMRYANHAKDGVVTNIEQMVMMVGEQGLHNAMRHSPDASELLDRESLFYLMQEQRRAIFAACLAREWAHASGDPRFEGAYVIGLLHKLGELVVRVNAQSMLGACVENADPAHSNSRAWVAHYGWRLSDLSMRLAREWELPDLLRAELDSEIRALDRRAELINLAMHVSRNAWRGFDSERLSEWVQRAAELMRRSVETMPGSVWRAHATAAHMVTGWYPNQKLDGEYSPLMPKPIKERRKQMAKPDTQSQEIGGSAAPNVEEPPKPDAAARERLDKLFAASGEKPTSAPQACALFVESLAHAFGYRKVVLVEVQKESGTLRVSYSYPASSAPVELNNTGLLSDLLRKPSALWLSDANRDKFASRLDVLAPLVSADNFFVHSLFVKKRPWALLFCVPHPTRPLDDQLYTEFKRHSTLLMLNMRELMSA